MKQEEIERRMREGRNSLKPLIEEETDYQSDQDLKKPQPPLVKEAMTSNIIALPTDFEHLTIDNDFLHVINTRQSHRVYTQQKMSLLELSYLLWCTQGVKEIRSKSYATLRTVPCGGARHEFECYMVIQNVDGLKDGYYHYLPMHHQIEMLKEDSDLHDFISVSLQKQDWACKANVVFYYSLDVIVQSGDMVSMRIVWLCVMLVILLKICILHVQVLDLVDVRSVLSMVK